MQHINSALQCARFRFMQSFAIKTALEGPANNRLSSNRVAAPVDRVLFLSSCSRIPSKLEDTISTHVGGFQFFTGVVLPGLMYVWIPHFSRLRENIPLGVRWHARTYSLVQKTGGIPNICFQDGPIT